MRSSPPIVVLRITAAVEAAKRVIVLVMGFGLLSLLHRGVQTAAEPFLGFARFDPASRYPRVFLDASDRIASGEFADARSRDGVKTAIGGYRTHPANRQQKRPSDPTA